jgi:RNA polymerase sigma-70 factor (ECF subfamily)
MLTDKQFISGIMLKDQKVFEMFVNQYKDYVFTICNNIIKDHTKAEEATQDTFMKVFKSILQFNQESKLSSWMYKIAYRTSLDYIKKRKQYSVDTLDYVHLADSQNIGNEFHHKELMSLVKQLIKELGPVDSTVLNLFYFEQKSIKEIEEILELTTTNIKTKLFRSRKWLRKEIAIRLNTELEVLL